MGVASLCCEISISQAKNVELKLHGSLFVRCYLPAGKNNRVQLNTQEIISQNSSPYWNESFSLECQGTEDSISNLKKESVVFELRWRSTNPVLGKMGGSQLLSRVEIPWKAVLESPNMEMQKWVAMSPKKKCLLDGIKSPSLYVSMRFGVPKKVIEEEKRSRNGGLIKKWDNCGCCSEKGCNCGDYDIFALAAAFEAL